MNPRFKKPPFHIVSPTRLDKAYYKAYDYAVPDAIGEEINHAKARSGEPRDRLVFHGINLRHVKCHGGLYLYKPTFTFCDLTGSYWGKDVFMVEPEFRHCQLDGAVFDNCFDDSVKISDSSANGLVMTSDVPDVCLDTVSAREAMIDRGIRGEQTGFQHCDLRDATLAFGSRSNHRLDLLYTRLEGLKIQ